MEVCLADKEVEGSIHTVGAKLTGTYMPVMVGSTGIMRKMAN